MSFTRFKTVITKKDRKCYSCGMTINPKTACSYGVTTDSDVVGSKGIRYGHFCTLCRNLSHNK